MSDTAHTSTEQPEALRLADDLDSTSPQCETWHVSAELRRLHARVQELEANFAKLQNPESVHLAMLTGQIAKISLRMCAHAHGADCLAELEAAQAQRAPLSEDQRRALEICRARGSVIIATVQREMGIEWRAAYDLCQSLVDLGGLTDEFGISPMLDQSGITQEKQG